MKYILKKFVLKPIIAIVIILAILFGVAHGLVAMGSVTPNKQTVDSTKYIAHRGLSSEYYQNSYEAYLHASQSDFFYGIETDVYFTKDKQLVCCHDENPFEDSTTLVADLDYETAMKTPLLRYEDDKASPDEDVFICDFATYLSVCKQGGKVPVIELKMVMSAEQLDLLVKAIETEFELKDVIIISFKNENISALLDTYEGVVVQQLCSNLYKTIYYVNAKYTVSGNKNAFKDSKYFLRIAHKHGTILSVWTVNDKETADKYAQMGYDFIVTDYDFSK